MNQTIELARISADGYVLEFPRGFRFFGLAVTLLGLVLWGALLLEWREVGLQGMAVNQFLVVKVLSLPFGVGLLIWSTQKIAVLENRIVRLHLGRVRELERSSARIYKSIQSGVYLRDGHRKRLFASRWLVGFDRLVSELSP